MIDNVIDYLNKELKISLNSTYYRNIAIWDAWWKGKYKPFHTYREKDGNGRLVDRDLYTLRMAKKVSEDWASMLFNERTKFSLTDKAAEEFLLGDKENNLLGILDENDFLTEGNELIEKTFAKGTGAFVLRLENVLMTQNGQINPSEDTQITIEYLSAENIIPLTVKHRKIQDVAFVSEVIDKGKKYIYIETHILSGGQYEITNRYFKLEEGTLIPQPLPEGMIESFKTGADIKLFSITKPNISNNIDESSALGISVYANAIDNLIGTDLAFNNFCRDFKLGGKKVFLNEDLTKLDENGNILTPDDVAQQLFVSVGDASIRENGNTEIWEHNPALRVDENTSGIQAQLDYLSFKCGLGAKFYRFTGDGVITTATEYKGGKQDLAQNTAKHYKAVSTCFKSLFRSILWVGQKFFNPAIKYDCGINIDFNDGYITDKDSERLNSLQEVRDGIKSKWEYRMEQYGEDEETARKMAAEASKGTGDTFGGLFGDE